MSDATPDTPTGRRPIDPDILAVLEYVSRGRSYVGVEPYPDFQARRALGRLHDEGSLRSQASGTPAEVVAEALRDVRLNLGPNALESIYGGSNHLILSGAERRDIGLIAIQALIEAGLLPPSPHDMGRGTV